MAGSSRFAVTCGLMRQYMRDQQQGGAAPRPPAVSLLLSPPSEETDARTIQLFPASAAGLSQPSQQQPEAQTTAPLTIFYDGRVLVFDDFPADREGQGADGAGGVRVLLSGAAQEGRAGDRGSLRLAYREEGVSAAVPPKEEAQDLHKRSLPEGDGGERRCCQAGER